MTKSARIPFHLAQHHYHSTQHQFVFVAVALMRSSLRYVPCLQGSAACSLYRDHRQLEDKELVVADETGSPAALELVEDAGATLTIGQGPLSDLWT